MRCFGDGDPLYESYHDHEWGRPIRDDRGLFERICLEAFQSGISWVIVLHKRAALRRAFHDFDPQKVSTMTARDVRRLLNDASIIRNRMKIESAIANARALLDLDRPLAELFWAAAEDRTRLPKAWSDVPPFTDGSTRLAKELKRRGFRFVGPTTAYASMQAAGIVNDHLVRCEVRDEVEELRRQVMAS